MPHLEYVRRQILHIAEMISAPETALPSFEAPGQPGRAHISEEGDEFHYVVEERGTEVEHFTTSRVDDLLYHVFVAVTFDMSVAHEAANRSSGEDSRRQLFAHQIELLDRLNPEWAIRRGLEHRAILAEQPFEDSLSSAAPEQSEQSGHASK